MSLPFHGIFNSLKLISLLTFFKVFVWLIVLGIVFYVIMSWINEEAVENKRDVIRKTWYTILIFGALIYWTGNPNSIFTDWKNYLIVGIVFVLIDAFVFLGMYILKIGNHELAVATKQIAINDKIVVSNREKVKNLTELLKEQGIPEYYSSKNEYIELLDILLAEYGFQEGLDIEIVRFETESEQKEALKEYKNIQVDGVIRILKKEQSFFKGKLALHPVILHQELYVIKITSKTDISDMDISLIGLLIITYDMVIEERIIEGGAENEN